MFIYVCGPTVYDSSHIGNIRPVMTFDIFVNILKVKNKEIKLIHNITDIDDKIIKKAKELEVAENDLSTKISNEYKNTLLDYGIKNVASFPTVTDNMDSIILFITRLIDKNYAYVSGKNVFFDISKGNEYGKLSNQDISKLKSVKVEGKKNPYDFALWKSTNEGITFGSPWGEGRPGWHTECVAIIDKLNKSETIDIHAGGIDLIFPHHENENVQYKAANDKKLSKKWIHIGQVNLNNEKMAKITGNIIKASDFLSNHEPDLLRIIYLLANVNAPLNLTDELIENSKVILDKYKNVFVKSLLYFKEVSIDDFIDDINKWEWSNALKKLNTKIKEFNKNPDFELGGYIFKVMKSIGFIFADIEVGKETINMIEDMHRYKKEKNFKESDRLRDLILKKGKI